MTTFLYNFILTVGSDKMAVTDPHGWTLTIISVSVVFAALIILYFLYSLSGNIFSGKFKRERKPKKAKGGKMDGEMAAAIAMALDAELSSDDEVAAAVALYLYLNDSVHDVEPGFLTISRNSGKWSDKSLTFRRLPR